MNKECYTRLKMFRKEKGFTQEEVASYLNISRQAISQWERGIAYPDIDNLKLLSQLYQVSINDLTSSNVEELLKQETAEVKNKNDIDLHSCIEILSILIILALSSQIPFLGMIVPIFIILWGKKNKKNIKVIYLVSLIGFLIGTYNTFNILSYYFLSDYGVSTIEINR